MRTQHHEIGETAGKIYKLLEKSNPQTTNALSKEIGVIDTALFNQALGWLARAGNVNFEKNRTSWGFLSTKRGGSAASKNIK